MLNQNASKTIKCIISKGKKDAIKEEAIEDEENDIVLNFGHFEDPLDEWHEVVEKRGTTSRRD